MDTADSHRTRGVSIHLLCLAYQADRKIGDEMKIDTLIEWFVILIGILMAIAVLHPAILKGLGRRLSDMMPDPNQVNDWLKRIGL